MQFVFVGVDKKDMKADIPDAKLAEVESSILVLSANSFQMCYVQFVFIFGLM
jgi:hypothetical protein